MKKYLLLSAVPVAFVAGIAVSHIAPQAHAQPAPLSPEIIDLAAVTNADLGNIVSGTIRSRNLVQTPNGTLSIQTGDAPKHTHAQSDEIQYVISGEGKFWLGGEARSVHAGDLIVVPRGTVHGGSVATGGGQFKVLALKMPPPVKGDTQKVQ